MLRLALKDLAAHAGRYAMSLVAVVIGIAFLSGTMQLREGIAHAFADLIDFQFDADAYLVPAKDGEAVLAADWMGDRVEQVVPLEAIPVIEAVDGVDRVAPDIRGGAVLAGADGTAIAGTGAGAPGLGLSWGSYEHGSTVRVAAGRPPAASGEVAIMEDTAERGHLAVGDATTVFTGETVLDVKVVGILEADAAGFLGASLTFFTTDQALDLYARDGGVARVAVYASDAGDTLALAERITEALAQVAGGAGSAGGEPGNGPAAAGDGGGTADAAGGAVAGGAAAGGEPRADGIGGMVADSGMAADSGMVVTGDELRADYTEELRAQLGAIGTLLTVFAAVALFIGCFVIFNTFAIAVRRQTAHYALLRSLGASGRQVFGLVLGQGAVIGLIGSAIGIVAGRGLATLAVRGFSAMGMSLGDHATTRASDVAVALAVGVAATLAAAAAPARRAGRVAPIEALRQAESEFGKPLRGRAWAGGAVLLLGAAGTAAGLATDPPSAVLVGLGAAGLVGGALVASPALTALGGRGAGLVLGRLMRPVGRLAVRNVQRNPRRGAATAGALMIGVALVSAVGVAAASMRASITTGLGDVMTADLMVSATGSAGVAVPELAIEALSAAGGVARVDPLLAGTAEVDGEPVFIGGVPVAAIDDTLNLGAVGVDGSPVAAGQVIVSHATARDRGWAVGDRLELTGAAGAAEVEIGDVYDRGLGGEDMMMGPALFEAVIGAPSDWLIYQTLVRFEDGADPAAARAAVAAAAAPFMVLTVQDREEVIAAGDALVDIVLAVAYSLLALSVVIAVLGIVNTLALSVIERRREVGLLRAVGLGRGQTAGAVVLESVLLSLGGALSGAAIGTGVGVALARTLRDQGLTDLVIPWGQLGAIVLLGALAGVLAAVAPAIRAVRVPVLVAAAG
ncbi:MAG: ABC transporter permease [Bifidobacteriaceae bacterium]|jgi:putative ABC transport system permease protein|nr:ABC transporter permease [Bifidobacteriaceae bacterium]